MSETYRATGINLKSIPLGESDRLLTILTREAGLVRAVAPGARKHKSSLRGRSTLFVMNDLLIVKGRSLDKVIQAEGLASFPAIAQDLGKLTASQYLAELVLGQALSEHPQEELFELLHQTLNRLDQQPSSKTLIELVQAIYHVLSYAGLAPQVHQCSATRQWVNPDFSSPDWRIEFDAAAGGVRVHRSDRPLSSNTLTPANVRGDRSKRPFNRTMELTTQLNAAELAILQHLAQADCVPVDAQQGMALSATDSPSENSVTLFSGVSPTPSPSSLHPRIGQPGIEQPAIFESVSVQTWLSIERLLRHYAQYHLDQPIRSAALIETCFLPTSMPSL